jgi:hypothetical protein
LGIFASILGVFSSHRLTLTATDISAPRFGFSRHVTVVPRADIQRLDMQTVRRHRFLNIHHSKGKLTISQSYLPDAAAFEKVCSVLALPAMRTPDESRPT